MKGCLNASMALLGAALLLSACARAGGDQIGPDIRDISTSDKVVVISDCPATAVTITARVTDVSPIKKVLLWYRVDSNASFASTKMDLENEQYTATIEGADLQGHGYGPMEFYITAEDSEGNSSRSQIDNSVQFLPCVNS